MIDDDEAYNILNKIRSEIDHEKLHEQIAARHSVTLRAALKALPSDLLCEEVAAGLAARGDLSYKDLHSLQYAISKLCWEAMRDAGD